MAKKEDLTWHRVNEAGNGGVNFVKEGRGRFALVNDKRLLFMRVKDELFCISPKCPHNGASLHAGLVSGYILACPLHRFEFDLRDGKNVSGEGYYLENFPVEIREDGMYVGMEKPRGFLAGWW
ncbi:MAG: Rieske 2Fe-2S domain-containing protein [Bacteroidia bacterium]|nr:Rieske 2Fe-2S domain-containing protein [Bacteroidia bacterium]